MNLKIKNFAVIGEADVTVDGLTVIAGPNGSGKSTVGKLFYSLIIAARKTKTEYKREKLKRIRNVLLHNEDLSAESFFAVAHAQKTREKAADILETGSIAAYKDSLHTVSAEKIEKVLSVSESDFFKACALKMFKYEFGYQLLNVNNTEHGELEYKDADTEISARILSNTQIDIKIGHPAEPPDSIKAPVIEPSSAASPPGRAAVEPSSAASPPGRAAVEAFYIDTPYIMDETGFGLYHRRELKNRLFGDTDNLAQKVFGQLLMGAGETVNIMNVSAGFKTALMLKRMYAKGMLSGGNLLILDEPEIHLHPDLQITLAQILVMLVKSGDIKALVNTHSPYFLEAIEVFAEKRGIEDKCRYYITEGGESSRITETTGDVEKIYALLAEPFRKLERIRNEDL